MRLIDREREQKSEKASGGGAANFFKPADHGSTFRTLECSCFLALLQKSCGVRTCIGLFSNGYVWAATPNRARAFRQYCQNKFWRAREIKRRKAAAIRHICAALCRKKGDFVLSLIAVWGAFQARLNL